MQIHDLLSLLDTINAEFIILLCHHNADPDAIGSALALSSLLQRIRPRLKVEIGAAEGPSRLSKHILNELSMTLVQNPSIEETDAIILLDTNTIQQLGDWVDRVKGSKSPIIVIDHHASHPDTEQLATLYLANENVSSTCEIIYQFYADMKLKITEIEAKLLFLGVAFDTRHFILANSTTLKIVADLIDSGIDAQETLSLLSLPMSDSERLARLKAAKRVKLLKIQDWIIAISLVGAYQASAARALISLGAHVGIVVGQKDTQLKISMRATRNFYTTTKVHLGRDIAKPLGVHLKGMGGGHALSAGVNGKGEYDGCLKYCVELLNDILETVES
jgi:phosphoesterase RecJ-like protein